MKKKRVEKNNGEKKPKQKVRMIDEFFDGNRGEYAILTTTTAKRYAKEMTDWAKDDPEAIALTQFVSKHLGVAMSTFYKWTEQSEDLARALGLAKVYIAARREHGAMTNKFAPGPTMKMMPFYDMDHKAIDEWKSNLGQKQGEGNGGERFIVLDRWADVGVPNRKKDDE